VRHLPAALRPVVTFAYLTGWRLRSEILPLAWRPVDWQGRVVRLDPKTTKNKEGRSFRFTATLEQLLKGQQAEHDRRYAIVDAGVLREAAARIDQAAGAVSTFSAHSGKKRRWASVGRSA